MGTKWEYKVIAMELDTVAAIEKFDNWITGLGNDGWELATILNNGSAIRAYLKRPQ